MNKLSRAEQAQIVNALCQGMSLRAITRLLNVHRTTVMKILERSGEYCEELQQKYMRKLDLTDLQLDEIWTFCRKKQNRLSVEEKTDLAIGDQYVFYAIERNTKLVPGVDDRQAEYRNGNRIYGPSTSLHEWLPHSDFNGLFPRLREDDPYVLW